MSAPVTSATTSTPASIEAGNANSSQSSTSTPQLIAIAKTSKAGTVLASLGCAGLVAGIIGAVVYTNPPDAAAQVAGIVLLSIGWPICYLGCCCGGGTKYYYYRQQNA